MYVFLDADSLMEQGLLYLAANQIESGYNMGKARIRPLDDQRLRAKFTCFTGNLGNSITTNLPRMDSGNGAFTFSDVNLFEKINGFDTTVNVMIDVDFFIRAKTSGGKMSFITEKGIGEHGALFELADVFESTTPNHVELSYSPFVICQKK